MKRVRRWRSQSHMGTVLYSYGPSCDQSCDHAPPFWRPDGSVCGELFRLVRGQSQSSAYDIWRSGPPAQERRGPCRIRRMWGVLFGLIAAGAPRHRKSLRFMTIIPQEICSSSMCGFPRDVGTSGSRCAICVSLNQKRSNVVTAYLLSREAGRQAKINRSGT